MSQLLIGVDLAVQSGAAEFALAWGQLLVGHAGSSATDLVQLAKLLLAVQNTRGAVAALHVARRRDDFVPSVAVADILVAAGVYDEAAEVLLLVSGEDRQLACERLATLCLWRGDVEGASSKIDALSRLGADEAVVQRLRLAVDVLTGNHAQAESRLDSLGELPGRDAETRAWRAEVLASTGRSRQALDEARRAGDASPDHGHYVALRILEALCALQLGRRPDGDIVLHRAVDAICGAEDGDRVSRLMRRVYLGRALRGDRVLSRFGRILRLCGVKVRAVESPAEVESILQLALKRLGGNRNPVRPTIVCGGRLERLVVDPSPRSLVKDALGAVRYGGEKEASRRLANLAERFPEWPHPHFYHAELMMWVGRLDQARRDLDRALAIRVWNPEVERGCWPRIGLAGVTLLQGDANQALRLIRKASSGKHDPPAQPYYAWHGEILYALGRLEEARDMLQPVCGPRSGRVGSLLTLALVEIDLGECERSRQIVDQVARIAPALLIDIGQEDVCDPAGPGAGALTVEEIRGLAVDARQAMRGNRTATCVTFVDSRGRLRAIPPNGLYRLGGGPSNHDEIRMLIDDL